MNIKEIRAKYPQYDGLSDAELVERIRRKYYPNMDLAEFHRRIGIGSSAAAAETGPAEAALIGAGKFANDMWRGGQDLFYAATGDEQARAELRDQMAQEAAAYKALTERHPVATTVGEIAPTLAIPGGTGGIFARMGREALAGGAMGGLSYAPTTEGRLQGAALGGGLGAAGGALGGALSKLGVRRAVAPEEAELIDMARNLGYRLTPAQRTGSIGLGRWETGMSRDSVMSHQSDKIFKENQALVNRIGRKAIGMEKEEGFLTDGVLDAARQRIRKGYDELTPKGFKLDLGKDDKFINDLVRIDSEFMRSPVRGDQWSRYRDQFLEMAEEPLSADGYHRVTSEIAKKARAVGSGESADPALERALYATREAVDDAFERALGPGVREQLGELRSQYRYLKLFQKPGVIKEGNLKEAPLRTALKRQGKGIVRDQTPVGQIARVGEHFAPSLPTSGTAEGLSTQMATQTPSAILTAMGRAALGQTLGRAYLSGENVWRPVANTLGAVGRGPGVGGIRIPPLDTAARALGVQQAREQNQQAMLQHQPNTVASRLGAYLPQESIESLRNEEWFARWLLTPVRADRNTIQDHRTRLAKLTAGRRGLTKEQRAAIKKIQQRLAELQGERR